MSLRVLKAQYEAPTSKSRTLDIIAGAVEKAYDANLKTQSHYTKEKLASTMHIAVFEEPHSDGSLHHHAYLGFDEKSNIITQLVPHLQCDKVNIEIQVPNVSPGRTSHRVRILRYLAVPTDTKPMVDTAPLLYNMEIPADVLDIRRAWEATLPPSRLFAVASTPHTSPAQRPTQTCHALGALLAPTRPNPPFTNRLGARPVL